MAGGEGLERHALTLCAERQNLYLSFPGASGGEGGTIDELSFSGARRRVFASGLREASATALMPRSGALWATVTSGGDVPDYLARIEDGAFYGWPSGSGGEARTPEVIFAPGSRPRSLAFARGGAFPERYRTGAFVQPSALLAHPDGSLLVGDGVSRVFRVSWAGP